MMMMMTKLGTVGSALHYAVRIKGLTSAAVISIHSTVNESAAVCYYYPRKAIT